jgi:hypothetical protein
MSEKHYIGRGYQKDGSYTMTVELEVDELLEHAEQRGTRRIVRARLVKCMTPSKGMTHTIYVQVDNEERDPYGAEADQQELEVRAYDEANC